MTIDWICLSEVSVFAKDVSPQRLRFLLSRAHGQPVNWRGASLIYREFAGRGGRSGTSYKIRKDSLPVELQLRIEALHSPVEAVFNPSAKAAEAAAWWAHFLRPILAHPKHSRERRAAMAALAGVEVCGPHGKWFAPSLRDIERKISKAETHGLKGLMRKRRETKPESRTILTKRCDAATAGLDETVRSENPMTGGVTFGFTAEYGKRIAAQWETKDIGLEGGQVVRVGERVRELIVAKDAGYLIQNVIANTEAPTIVPYEPVAA